MYVIGVGNGVDSNELEEIVLDFEYVFIVFLFRVLRIIVLMIWIGICEGNSKFRKEGFIYFFLNWDFCFVIISNFRVMC